MSDNNGGHDDDDDDVDDIGGDDKNSVGDCGGKKRITIKYKEGVLFQN